MAEMLTKNDYAYTQVRQLILSGDLGAGEVIAQGKLARELGLSTTPLREAIRRLATEGLVELAAHRDARVSPLTATEATHLYEMREALDPFAASLAAERRTDATLAEIEDRLAALDPIRPGDVGRLMAHREFHRAVYRAARNPVLSGSLDQLWDRADRYRSVGAPPIVTKSDERRIAAEHRALVDAIKGGDGPEAARVMLAHIRSSHGRRAIDALAEQERG